jgi:protein-tyrosine phosphatase
MASLAAADGIGAVVATPHIVEGLYEGEDMGRRLEALEGKLESAGVGLRLLPGAEVPLSYCLSAPAARLSSLSLNRNGFLLMETAQNTFEQLRRAAWQVRLHGLYPVLAHPERIPFLQEDPGRLEELTSAGECFCQLTAASLEGAFGKTIRRAAGMMVERGLAHLVATDAHSADGLKAGRKPLLGPCFELLAREYDDRTARLLLSTNPQRVVNGRKPHQPPAPGPGGGRSIWGRVTRLFS